ncbi:hypothetical protein BKM67_07055 [Streptococcus suis]|uniref:Uncharacterized protein n=1 Tax=Streptococcus suis TaxID=1307 RepID=A0AAD0KV52_STRSU|nr:hypothetical protein [Streptococcus suis]AWX95809.1 hypothetical protein BKM66_06505 [Streptococcus suis]AWX97804.1 hypothetical protein BKM67_07055 [Streptococcus suis]MCL4941733.1 hypothetical protein [Streptococcus suis]HEM3487736.1 hypothetical protein [Streptococcus suis]HEM3516545.1 hypothetical protein [Streptococcus suis]
MPYRKLTSRDRTFIKGQTDRLLNQMNGNAEYLATVQTYEAAKARANQAYLAMELEDDPEKKLRLAKLVETYTAQAQSILDDWEARNIKLILWLTVLFALSFIFPVNIILALLFAIWFYRNYLRSSRIAQVPKSTASQSLVTEEESYEDWLTKKIVTLNKDKREWAEGVLAKYDSLDEIAAGIGKINEIDKEAGKKILHRYQAILADIEKLPDSDQKTYYLDFHREMIADLGNVFEQLHIV